MPPLALGRIVVRHAYVDQVVANVLNELRQMSLDGRSVSAADLEAREIIQRAEQRGRRLGDVFRNDLDGDGLVKAAEIEKAQTLKAGSMARRGRGDEASLRDMLNREIQKQMAADANADGAIDLAEALTYLPADQQARSERRSSTVDILLALDPNGDGKIDTAEAEGLARQAFAALDSDGDGELSQTERMAYESATRAEAKAEQAQQMVAQLVAPCAWPGLPASAHVAVVTTQDGAALSRVSVAGQDKTTTIVRVNVQAGDEPMHLLLASSSPVIWTLEGAVGRVEGIALAGEQAGYASGVAGIDKSKVTPLKPGTCFPARGSARKDEATTLAFVQMLTSAGAGKVDVIASGRKTFIVGAPGGETLTRPDERPSAPDGTSPQQWKHIVRLWPAGIASIDPGSITATQPVETYDVLPGHAGLAQLVQESVLETEDDRTFAVLKPLRRYPANLDGSMSVIFYQPAAFPLPAGEISGACLLEKETRKVLAGNGLCQGIQPYPR